MPDIDPPQALIVALRTGHRQNVRPSRIRTAGGDRIALIRGSRCALCGQVWPCHAIQAADLLEAQGEALATLRPERS